MFQLITTLRRGLPVLAAGLIVAGSAIAQDASVERVYDEETGTYIMTRTIESENGGTIVTERTCMNGDEAANVSGCANDKVVTTAEGNTWDREKVTIRGPLRTRSFGRLTGPDGNTIGGTRGRRN